jgi:hypothetical protein
MKFSDDSKRRHAVNTRKVKGITENISNMAKRMTLNLEKIQVQVPGEK